MIANKEKDTIKKHIENIFHNQSYDLNRINQIFLEKNNCIIKTSWKGICRSNVYHLCHNIVCDLPGNFEIKKAYDRLNAREMEYLITYHEAQHFTYFFFFKQFKNTNQLFEAETEISAQGYFDIEQLIEKGEALMSTQAVANGIRYTNKEDWIYFPKEKRFSKVTGVYLSHPNVSLIGKKVFVEESKDNFILKLKYSSGEAYQQETAAKILIG